MYGQAWCENFHAHKFGTSSRNLLTLLYSYLELKEGKTPYAAIVDSAISRVRPVSKAAITTILGLIPLLFDAFFSSMAVTVMFGLGFATILTLLMLPVVYKLLYKIKCTPLV